MVKEGVHILNLALCDHIRKFGVKKIFYLSKNNLERIILRNWKKISAYTVVWMEEIGFYFCIITLSVEEF